MNSRGYAPHEGLFLKVFKDKENTKYFLKEHLSQEILKHMDLDSLYLENVSYVDDKLRKNFSDLVFSVNIGNEEFPASKIYFLFEHKGHQEPLVGMQILRYMALQWKEMLDQGQVPGKKLPPIIPIVIYQGRESWQVRSSFQDLVDMPSEEFKYFIPDFSFAFFNIGQIDERKVQQNVILKFYVAIIKSLDSPELRKLLPRLIQGLYESLETRTGLEYIEIFLKYLVKSTEVVSKEDYANALAKLPEGGERIMNTLAEEWKREGYEEAEYEFLQKKDQWISEAKSEERIKNTQDLLIEQLEDELDIPSQNLIDKIRSIKSYEILRGLFKKTRRVNSLDEFAKEVDKVI